MRHLRITAVWLVAAFLLFACNKLGGSTGETPLKVVERASRNRLKAFKSERELRQFLRDLAAAQKREREAASRRAFKATCSCVPASCKTLGCGVHPNGCGVTINCGPCGSDTKKSQSKPQPAEFEDEAMPAAPTAEAPSAKADMAGSASESITNVQHAGVDEGGIVKLHGDHLIVLRRGRLFTIKLAGGALEPISSVDAFGPEMNPDGTWYDEMLVSNDTIAVIGYSYERGGTEIGLFDIDRAGRLAYRSTFHLRSNDYYSSRNYASRLIEQKLIFYSPLYLSIDPDDPFAAFPAQRKWHKGAEAAEFRRTVAATDVYRPILPSATLTLHTVTVCDLAKRELDCKSTVVLGPSGRVFYVSPDSVFVWVTGVEPGEEKPRSIVYRMPLDRSEPSALRVSGAPVDQFSFLERDAHLNVLVRADAKGEGMWGSEHAAGDVALLRVPLDRFSDGADEAPASSYTLLPKPKGDTFQNRFVGDHLLYGTGSGWGSPNQAKIGVLYAYRYAGSQRAMALPLRHGVDRIEAIGEDAIVVGTDGKDLSFTPIALDDHPWVAKRYTRKDASQGELRSHGFFYKPDGARNGLLGLPIRESGRPGYEHLIDGSASVLFIENRRLRLKDLGALEAGAERDQDDGCRASCVDWYGNARPVFAGGRIFALLGYEIVEGRLQQGRIAETRRVSFSPVSATK